MVAIEKDGNTVSVKLDELTRLEVQEGSPIINSAYEDDELSLHVFSGAFVDVAQNPNILNMSMQLPEIPDELPPQLRAVELNFSTGIVSIIADETLSLIPLDDTRFNRSKMFMANASLGRDFPMGGLDIVSAAGTTVRLQMTEALRASSLRKSGVTGGDNSSLLFEVEKEAFFDVINNNNTAQEVTVVEFPDVREPVVLSGKVNYSDGILVLTADETLDNTPAGLVDPQFMFFSEFDSGDAFDRFTNLSGAIVSEVDGLTVTVRITEAQRVSGLLRSDVHRGSPVILDLLPGAVTDYGGNNNAENLGIALAETTDTVQPAVATADVDYGTGILTITFSETVDLSPSTNLNLSKIALFNFNHTSVNGTDTFNWYGFPYATVENTKIYLNGTGFPERQAPWP